MNRGQETRLVILDFDGVLADSEIIALAVLQQCLGELGVRMTWDELIDRFLGASTADIVAFASAHADGDIGPQFRDGWYRRLFARYDEELQIMPNARELLTRLDGARVRYCIASGSSRDRLGFALERIGLAEVFADSAFSAESVGNGKPEPDLFLFAADAMGVSPRACLVVEDALAGVEAAKRAGMKVLGYVGGRHLDSCRARHAETLMAKGAASVIDDLVDVCRHLNVAAPCP